MTLSRIRYGYTIGVGRIAMARQMYVISASDVVHAVHYLDGLLRNAGIQFADDVDPQEAVAEFQASCEISSKSKRAASLNEWAEHYLDSNAWKRLKLAIRKRRERRTKGEEAGRSVTMSLKAHELLKRLAARDAVTLSAALEQHLPQILNRRAKHNRK